MTNREAPAAASARRRDLVADALRYQPLPLVLEQERVGVLFSAKAGCTFVVKWFFMHAGLLDKANAHGPWIHHYRTQLYYHSEQYRPEALLEPGTRIVKFVRNPYDRAVSSYIHELRSGYDRQKVSTFLGRKLGLERLYSFREFVTYLESDSLTSHRCNPHHKSQVHRLEDRGLVKPTHVVRVEQAREAVPRLERELGLPGSDYDALRHSGHHTTRQTTGVACPDRARWAQPDGKPVSQFPPTHCFYDDDLVNRVRALYGPDFERYGYDPAEVPRPV